MWLVKIGSFHRVMRKAFLEPTHGRIRCSGKMYWDGNKRMPSGSQHLIFIHPAVEEFQFSSSPEKGPGSRNSVPSVQIMPMCSPVQSLSLSSQFRPCSRLGYSGAVLLCATWSSWGDPAWQLACGALTRGPKNC